MSQHAHPEVLVYTQWVFDYLNDPNVHLIEADMSLPSPTTRLNYNTQNQKFFKSHV